MPFEYDVRASVQQGLVPQDQEEADLPELDIELHDLKMQGWVSFSCPNFIVLTYSYRNEHALVLFSYLPPNELESNDSAPYRAYAIASFTPAGDTLTSITFDKVPYEGVSLQLLIGGPVIDVHYKDPRPSPCI
jgi:hypothetical protein